MQIPPRMLVASARNDSDHFAASKGRRTSRKGAKLCATQTGERDALSTLSRFYRIISFLVLGVLLLGVSFLYQRRSLAQKEKAP